MARPKLRPTLKPYRPLPGSRREMLLQRTGKVQVPFLVDPNTGEELMESARILEYLEQRYAL
jgi:glutathione S-transferase